MIVAIDSQPVVAIGCLLVLMVTVAALIAMCGQKQEPDVVEVAERGSIGERDAQDGRSTAMHTSSRIANDASATDDNMSLASVAPNNNSNNDASTNNEYDLVDPGPSINARPNDITYDTAPAIGEGKKPGDSVKQKKSQPQRVVVAPAEDDDRAHATLDPNAVDKSKFKYSCGQCKNHYMTAEDLAIHCERRGHQASSASSSTAAAAAAKQSVSQTSSIVIETSATDCTSASGGSEVLISPSWEIDMATLQLGKTLGQGAFGIVRVAEYGGEKVAVKMLKSFDADNHNLTDAEKAAFAQEAELMRALPPHRNVIRLIGVVTKTQPNCIVTAFAQNGSLEAYLKSNRGKLSPTQRLTMCIDAANGVMHLHKHKLVHRDIAARNFLIDARGTILITDFGMTRAVVSDSGTTRARTGPLRYMPPESLQKQEYSTASDVWAFGVLMWEVESGAATPYGHLTLPQTAMQVVMEGLRLEEPENCYPGLFDVMLRCWRTEVTDRATLDQILTELLRLSDNRRAEYWVPRLE